MNCFIGVVTHGHGGRKKSPTYESWASMHSRCTNPKTKTYSFYGGRGVTICARWKSFELFLSDMGERRGGTTLDRFPNKDGNYEPGNCRWATYKEQRLNQSQTRWLTHSGQTKCLSDWCAELGVARASVRKRMDKKGLSFCEAVRAAIKARKGIRRSRNHLDVQAWL